MAMTGKKDPTHRQHHTMLSKSPHNAKQRSPEPEPQGYLWLANKEISESLKRQQQQQQRVLLHS